MRKFPNFPIRFRLKLRALTYTFFFLCQYNVEKLKSDEHEGEGFFKVRENGEIGQYDSNHSTIRREHSIFIQKKSTQFFCTDFESLIFSNLDQKGSHFTVSYKLENIRFSLHFCAVNSRFCISHKIR